jgi:hypothetical protein
MKIRELGYQYYNEVDVWIYLLLKKKIFTEPEVEEAKRRARCNSAWKM